jgi:hypothetical protein
MENTWLCWLRSKSIPASPCRATPIRAWNPLIVSGGSAELSVKGQPDRMVKAGDSFQVPTETPHAAKIGDQPFKLVVTYTVEKDKPLATIVAE